MSTIRTISPIDDSLYAERPAHGMADIGAALARARGACAAWRTTPIEQRCLAVRRMVSALTAETERIALELTRARSFHFRTAHD